MFRLVLFFFFFFLSFSLFAQEEIGSSIQWDQEYESIDVISKPSLTQALKKKGPLDEWLSLKLAELYLNEKKYHDALGVLEKIPDEERIFAFWRTVLLSQTYLGLRQTRLVLTTLEELPPEPKVEDNPEQRFYRKLFRQALLAKIGALEARGKKAMALQARLWALFPDLEEPLVTQTPLGVSLEDKITRLHALHVLRKSKDLIGFITPHELAVSKLNLEDKCQALYELGRGLYSSDKTEEAHQAFSQSLISHCEGEQLAKSLYWQAKLEVQLEKFNEAIKTHQIFVKKFPHHQLTDDSYYALIQLYERLKEKHKAKKVWHQLIALSEGDMKAKALWDKAYNQYQEKRYKEAIGYFDQILSSKYLGDESHPQALYWKARALSNLKDKKQSNLFYKRVCSEYSMSYYSVMAAHRLGIKQGQMKPESLSMERPASIEIQEMLATVKLLQALHLDQEAQNILDYLTQLHRDKVQDIETLLAYQWMQSGDYYQTLKLAEQLSGGQSLGAHIKKNDALVWLFFPFAYPEKIIPGYQKTQLPRGVIEGIMREESEFRPRVVSFAGAIGVMQLMPETAKAQAKKNDLADFTLNDLNDPKTNVLLGATYFKEMLDQFNNSLPLAIMAYNAGPGNVRKWLKQKGQLPIDEFIEEVPFKETKDYVKRVLRSMQIYGLMIDEPKFKEPFFSLVLPQ